MDAAIGELQQGFLDARQIEASRTLMGLDTQLVDDGTYFVVERDGALAGCGGWSRRATLYGGDQSPGRSPALLDPAHDAARVRAMYTHPEHVRQGIGRLILARCEEAARDEGFRHVELMATLAGEPLYRACGYTAVERLDDARGGVPVPLVQPAPDRVDGATAGAYRPVAVAARRAAPRSKPSNYPAPFAALMNGREKRPLGELFGLANFGVNLVTLPPGTVSALRHAHTRQDEFVYVLAGRPTLHTDEGRTMLEPGMCAGFRAGTGNAHRLVNETDEEALYLEIGDRTPGDAASYPDDDLAARLVDGRWQFVRKDGTPY